MSAPRALLPRSNSREASHVSRLGILGTPCPEFRRPARGAPGPRPCPGRARREPNGAHVYGRPFRRFPLSRALRDGLRESADLTLTRRRVAPQELLHHGFAPLRAASEYASARRASELPPLLAARARAHLPRARRAGSRQDWIRYLSPGRSAGRGVSAALPVQIRPRRKLRTSGGLAALVRFLSSQPAEYPDGEIDIGYDAPRAGRHPGI